MAWEALLVGSKLATVVSRLSNRFVGALTVSITIALVSNRRVRESSKSAALGCNGSDASRSEILTVGTDNGGC
jgi:hypothetical protein